MFDRELLKEKYYESLDLKGGTIHLFKNFNDGDWYDHSFLTFDYNKFAIEVIRDPKLFRQSKFKIRIIDFTIIHDCHFAGKNPDVKLLVINIPKKDLLQEIQKQINFFHRKFIKLRVFL